MKIQFTQYAEQDIRQAVASYESLRLGISSRVLEEIRDKIEHITSHPESYQQVTKRLRRVELSSVPYQIYYSVLPGVIPVLGFLPARMHPVNKKRLVSGRLQEWKVNAELSL